MRHLDDTQLFKPLKVIGNSVFLEYKSFDANNNRDFPFYLIGKAEADVGLDVEVYIDILNHNTGDVYHVRMGAVIKEDYTLNSIEECMDEFDKMIRNCTVSSSNLDGEEEYVVIIGKSMIKYTRLFSSNEVNIVIIKDEECIIDSTLFKNSIITDTALSSDGSYVCISKDNNSSKSPVLNNPYSIYYLSTNYKI